jgi:hypothetical protein
MARDLLRDLVQAAAPNVESPMPKSVDKPWYTDRRLVAEKLDDWISSRKPQTETGKETDWLGWDAWVRTDDAARRSLR